jgi:DNA-binding MarR family transcriptional regulator
MAEDDTPNLGVLMFVAYRAMEQEIFEELRAAGYRATLAQGRLVARIGEHGNRLTELAESAQVTKQTAGVLVDQLEALGYVERVPDPTDARARIVRLARRGRDAQAQARVVEQRVLARWTEHLGPRGIAQLERQLVKLREITDPYRPA